MSTDEKTAGRIMAIDLGEKRHGVALSDPTRTLARGLTIIRRRSRREDFERFGALAQEHAVTLLLVGLPLTTGEPDTPKTLWMRDYAAALAAALGLPLRFWDESYSTIKADENLALRGKRGRQKSDRIDAVAAAVFLQEFLERAGE